MTAGKWAGRGLSDSISLYKLKEPCVVGISSSGMIAKRFVWCSPTQIQIKASNHATKLKTIPRTEEVEKQGLAPVLPPQFLCQQFALLGIDGFGGYSCRQLVPCFSPKFGTVLPQNPPLRPFPESGFLRSACGAMKNGPNLRPRYDRPNPLPLVPKKQTAQPRV